MELFEAIEKRRSIRKYKEGVIIPEEHKRKILEAGMSAPSACNTRAWEFVLVESDEMKEKIGAYKQQVRGSSFSIVICACPDKQSGISEGYWPQDCGAVAENMLLAATALGYGSCWCGVYPRMEKVDAFKEILGVSSLPFAVLTFGEADEAPDKRGFFDESIIKRV